MLDSEFADHRTCVSLDRGPPALASRQVRNAGFRQRAVVHQGLQRAGPGRSALDFAGAGADVGHGSARAAPRSNGLLRSQATLDTVVPLVTDVPDGPAWDRHSSHGAGCSSTCGSSLCRRWADHRPLSFRARWRCLPGSHTSQDSTTTRSRFPGPEYRTRCNCSDPSSAPRNWCDTGLKRKLGPPVGFRFIP